MTRPGSAEYFEARGCHKDDAAFAQKFFAPSARRLIALRAAGGAGKELLTAEICGHAVESATAPNVLVVASSATVADNLAGMVRSRHLGLKVLRVDRRCWWLLENDASAGEPIWPTPCIAILTADVLKHDDVADGICLADWNLIVVHGLDYTSHVAVRSLVVRYDKARVLCIADVAIPPEAQSARDTSGGSLEPSPTDVSMSVFMEEVTKFFEPSRGATSPPLTRLFWEYVDVAGLSDWRSLHKSYSAQSFSTKAIRWIDFTRGPEETAVLAALLRELRLLCDDPSCRGHAVRLVQAASSSLYSLEQLLLSSRLGRNRLAQRLTPGLQGLDESPPRIRDIANILLPRIKEVARDSKLAALLKALGDLAGSAGRPGRACIYARQPSTVDYLATALREGGHAVAGVTERMSFEERSRALRECGDAHGIVVVGPSVTWEDEPGFSWFLLYDLPVDPFELRLPSMQFVWSFYGKSPVVNALADTSNALPHEAVEREAASAGRRISSSHIMKSICPDSPDVE